MLTRIRLERRMQAAFPGLCITRRNEQTERGLGEAQPHVARK
jgi:hypothetical protein